MASHIGRRKFLATLGGAAVAWPRVVRAQQRDLMRRIGVLMNLAADDAEGEARLAAFLRNSTVLVELDRDAARFLVDALRRRSSPA